MRELLRFQDNIDLVVLDLETFSLNLHFDFNRPWQCGLLKVKGSKEIDSKDLYIKWSNCDLKISDEAARVTQYSQEKFDARAIDEHVAFEEMFEWIQNSNYIIFHNGIGFDLYLLIHWFKMHKKDWKQLPYKSIDTNCLAKAVKMNIPFKETDDLLSWQYKIFHKIGKGVKTNQLALGKEWNLDFDENTLHDGLNDTKLTLQIFNKLKYMVEI